MFCFKGDSSPMATTSLKAGKAIKETFSMPESVTILNRDFRGDVKVGEKVIPLSGLSANESFFHVFSFQLLKGNPANALKEPFSIILTEESATKLFGDKEAMGKTVVLNNDREYTITGIVKNPPVFSHIKFDMLGSVSTRSILKKDDEGELKWDNIWNNWVYVVLPENADLTAFQSSLDQLSAKEDPSVKHTHIELALQPMDDIMLGQDLNNQIGPVMGSTLLWSFSGLAFVVILSACFNGSPARLMVFTDAGIEFPANKASAANLSTTVTSVNISLKSIGKYPSHSNIDTKVTS